MNRSQLRTDMARDINHAFILADAGFIIPRADIDTETVKASYVVPFDDLYKLATAEMSLLVGGLAFSSEERSFRRIDASQGAVVPSSPPHQVSGRVPPSRPGLRGAGMRKVPA